jgi:hypothetical protein
LSAQHTGPDLVKVTEIFLIPSSFLVAALGTADTNLHRAAVSLLGFIISILWLVCSKEALTDHPASAADSADSRRLRRIRILLWLPAIFACGWFLSVLIHSYLWNTPLGKN